MPRALPASSAAPADAASPERWRRAGIPRTDVRTSTQTGSPDPAPPSVTPSAVEPPRRPTVTTSMTRRTSQATDSTTARAMSAAPCAAPRPRNPARASSRHHGARAPSSHGTATTPRAPGPLSAASRPRSSVLRSSRRPSQARNDPAADSPPSSSQPPSAAAGHHGAGRRRHRALVHRHRDVAGGAPAHHGVVLGRARTQHLALAVAGADDDGDPRPQPELGALHRLELADDRVGRHDARELPQRRAGQLAHGVAVEVVEPASRGEGGVGHELVGHAVDDEVARGEDHVGGVQALGLVLGQPGQLGGHRPGVERDPGAGPVDVVAPHALGQRPRLERGAVVGPQDPLADRVALARSPGRRSAGRPSTRSRRPRRRRGAPGPGPRRRR